MFTRSHQQAQTGTLLEQCEDEFSACLEMLKIIEHEQHGLLGGYLSVEIAKRAVGYRSATGDWFALIVPVGILIGRVGCWLHGCCPGRVCEASWYTLQDSAGVDRWPAVPLEIIFNLLSLLAALLLRWRKILPGQHFHLYLIAYGWFRFAHEFVRDTPRVLGPLSGYALAALVTAALGMAGFILRRRGKS